MIFLFHDNFRPSQGLSCGSLGSIFTSFDPLCSAEYAELTVFSIWLKFLFCGELANFLFNGGVLSIESSRK